MKSIKLMASLIVTTATIGFSCVSAYAYQNAVFNNDVNEESISNVGKYTFSVESNNMNYGPGSMMKLGNKSDLEGNASYIMDDAGNIKLFIDSNGLAIDGLAVDGLLYDSEGNQINTVEYIGNKYWNKMQEISDNDMIVFSNVKELELFMVWNQIYKEMSQGREYEYHKLGGGKGVGVYKRDMLAREDQPSEAYKSYINSLVDQIDKSKTIDEKAEDVQVLVAHELEYSDSYLYSNMDNAINNKSGVCYHYTKLVKDILTELGIKNEIMSGSACQSYGVAEHVWNIYYNENGKKTFLDATAYNAQPVTVNVEHNIPTLYLQNYRNATIR